MKLTFFTTWKRKVFVNVQKSLSFHFVNINPKSRSSPNFNHSESYKWNFATASRTKP